MRVILSVDDSHTKPYNRDAEALKADVEEEENANETDEYEWDTNSGLLASYEDESIHDSDRVDSSDYADK